MNLDTLLAKFGLQKKRTAAQDGVVASYMRTAIETIYSGFQVSDDRLRVWADIERMVGGDEFAAEAVDCLVGDILRVTSLYDQIVTVECEDENLKGVCEEIIKRSGIQSQARQIAYPLVKLHNSYAEFVIDGQARFNRIVPIQSPKTIYRNTDVHGQLLGGSPDERTVGKCAYDQRDITNRFLAGFYPWQIVHWRVPPYDDYGYGIPFLKAARANWLKLCMTEDTLPLARLLRAYMKLVHEVPVPDNATPEMIDQIMEEYKKRLLTKQFNLVADSVLSRQNTPSPYRVDTDFFLPKNAFLQGKVTMLDPQNAQLQNHGDIDLLRNRYFARLKVPKARLANEQDVRTKATMGDINTAYAGTVIGYQMDTLAPIVDLVQRALFLDGYDLDRLDPSLKFLLPSPFVKDEKQRAEVEEIESRTAVNYNQIGALSNDTIRQTYLGMSADDSAREQEKADEEPKPPTAEFPASENKPTEAVLKELYKLRREALNGNGDHPDPSSLP